MATADSALERPTGPAGNYTRITLAIAAAVGTGQMSYNFWSPFLPLFMLEIGAKDEANAIFWIAVATGVQGIGRLISAPIWGWLSDRSGRKQILLRCLVFATISNVITASIGAPWQLSISFALQGIFSGYVPASVALTTVSVPDAQINKSLSMVTGAQYLGNTLGPMLGALFAATLGYRGATLIASTLPLFSFMAVLFFVPRDIAAKDAAGVRKGERIKLEPFKPSLQFWLSIAVFFVIFVMNQQIRLLSPIAIKDIDPSHVDSLIGVTFTIGGIASALSLLFLAPILFKPGKLRRALVMSSCLCGVCMLVLAVSGTVPLYVAGFGLFSLAQAAMVPAANTLIAGNAPRSRRGTAFGIASSAQAVAFMVGPFSSAIFAAVSLSLGFVFLAAVLFALAILLSLALREPAMSAAAE